ncbi:TPA: hypothetical protein ACKFQQ_005568, partial [Klebsiella variicola]
VSDIQTDPYVLACILMHAVKTEPARFWRVFGWFVAYSVRNALRASQAVKAKFRCPHVSKVEMS